MKTPVVDGHIHLYGPKCLDYFRKYRPLLGFDYVNIACICGENGGTASNLFGAVMKLEDPGYFAHAGLYYPSYPVETPIPSEWEFGAQAKELMDIGFDGMKMLEAKPTRHKALQFGVNDPAYNAYFEYLQEAGIHIVWHACDPETFWDKDKAPAFAFEEGWFYGDGTYPSKEQLYSEVYDVLERYPNLKATFAHFFFLSDFPDDAKKLLDTYPNVCLDITPGREMYDNFTHRRDLWKEFFEQYSDRIVFGTDMTSDEFQGGAEGLVGTMRRFLTTEDRFEYWDFPIYGLGLSEKACENICGGNFACRVSPAPKPINKAALKSYAERTLPLMSNAEARAWLEDYFGKTL